MPFRSLSSPSRQSSGEATDPPAPPTPPELDELPDDEDVAPDVELDDEVPDVELDDEVPEDELLATSPLEPPVPRLSNALP